MTPRLEQLYRDLHAAPELSFQEHRTAALVAAELAGLGIEVTTGVGGTGVVGVLRNGPGPTALLRADMDALPVLERTGLPYASAARGTDRDGREVPVMHACGHDMHVTCLLGAAAALAADRTGWAGTALLVFQPAEEVGSGARAMLDDGLLDRFPRPDVVLGQHVSPMPAGFLGLRAGPAFAASDTLAVTLYGRGGHASRPETGVDPVVLAAATVMRLQTVVSREIGGTDTAVVTVASLHAGTKGNVIPDEATLTVNIRSYDPVIRSRVLAAVDRIIRAEALASGAPKEPSIEAYEGFPPVVNDPAAVARTTAAFERRFGGGLVLDPGPVTGSEDVGVFATAAGVPCVYWLLGGADGALFAGETTIEGITALVRDLPSNHSALYAPAIQPTLDVGIGALVAAAHEWLPPA